MDRRDFIKTTGTLLATATLSGASALAESPVAPGRSNLPMNRNWRYSPSRVEGAQSPHFDDSSFESVVVPHANIQLPWHGFDENDYAFVSTYRRRFKFPRGAEGKRVFVDFEGAMTASTVWINGVLLGEYKGGFTPFSFELTQHLRKDAENVLVVQVDSTERADIPPFGYEIDYLTFGGIYREVALRVVPRTYIDNISAHSKDVLSGAPSLDVDCFLAGLPVSGSGLSLAVELRDRRRQSQLTRLILLPAHPSMLAWKQEVIRRGTLFPSPVSTTFNSGTYSSPSYIPFMCNCSLTAESWMKIHAASGSAKRSSPTRASH